MGNVVNSAGIWPLTQVQHTLKCWPDDGARRQSELLQFILRGAWDTQTHRHTDRQTRRHTDTQTHRQADRQTGRYTDRQTGKQLCAVVSSCCQQAVEQLQLRLIHLETQKHELPSNRRFLWNGADPRSACLFPAQRSHSASLSRNHRCCFHARLSPHAFTCISEHAHYSFFELESVYCLSYI